MADSGVYAGRTKTAAQATLDSAEKHGRAALAAAPDDLPPEMRERLESAVATIGRKEVEYVVAGLFNAGKSTLLNGLLRQVILPHSDRPETGAPAWLRRRKTLRARVQTRGGVQEDLAPEPQEIAKRTSLYDENGHHRSDSLAEKLEIDSPKLPLDERMSIIDLPGLRDSEAMNTLALSIAYQADVVIWMFRSDHTFSKEDAEAVSAITATCGAHVVQLVVNVISEKPKASSWRAFKKERLPVHRLRISENALDSGLDDSHAANLLAVHARGFRHGFWGVTYGGRELRRFFRQAAKKDIGVMKTARLVRLARAAVFCRQWSDFEQSAAESAFETARQLHAAYQERMARRARLQQDAQRLVDQCFSNLKSAMGAAATAQAAQISAKGYKADMSYTSDVVEAACDAVTAHMHNLAFNLSSLAIDPEARAPEEADHQRIRESFVGASAGQSPEAALRALAASEIGLIETRKLGLSVGRAWNWIRGRGDTEAASAVSELQDKIRRRMGDVSVRLAKQQSAVKHLAQSSIEAPPIPVVPPPDPARRDALGVFAARLNELGAMAELGR
ncbi:MAG: dynamin family protein [Hyphomonadaceae bacterium]